MQRFLFALLCKISLFFSIIHLQASDQQALQVSQVRDVVKNIEIATQIGQGGQDQFSQVFGDISNLLTVDMTSLSTQELQSIAFGGYTFIANPYNSAAGVSANIVKDLLPLKFVENGQPVTQDIYVGLFASDEEGNLLPSLVHSASDSDTTNTVDHFKLYMFKGDGTMLGSGPEYIPLNKYYSQAQHNFITPAFTASQKLKFLINKQVVAGTASQIQYPYRIVIKNISGIGLPNRYLNFTDLTSADIFPSLTANSINVFYQTLDSLEIIVGNSAFSFNQNSLNQSTDIAVNGICADINQYIASLINSGMQLIFAAIDMNGDIISDITQTVKIDHYLLYIFDQKSSLKKAVYIDPAYVTAASYFKINQSQDGVTVRINGHTVTQNQQYLYPVMINLAYSSGVTIPALASIPNQISLKESQTLSNVSYTLTYSTGSPSTLSLTDPKSFTTNWLDTINACLGIGQTVLVNATVASSGNQLTFTAYSLANPISSSPQILEQSFALPAQLSNLVVTYQFNASQPVQTLSTVKLSDSWIAIIPSATPSTANTALSSLVLQKLSTYDSLKAILANKNIVFSAQVTSVAQLHTIPGWPKAGTTESAGQGFSLQLDQMQAGNGYFFVEDTSFNSKQFKAGLGVAALSASSGLLKDFEQKIVPDGSCTIMLLGFDSNHNYISNILDPKTPPVQFGLFIFDAQGNKLPNSPVFFSANDYIGLPSGQYQLKPNLAKSQATFTFSGLGSDQTKSLIYPFALKVTWQVQGGPVKPSHKTIPVKIPTIPTNMTIPIMMGDALTKFGCGLSSKNSLLFNTTFINTINSNLKNIKDSVQVEIVNSAGTITAIAYVNAQKIAESKALTLPGGQTISSLLYQISGNVAMSLTVSEQKKIWLQFQVVNNPLSYQSLQLATLFAVQKIISLNETSIQSNVDVNNQINGWNFNLIQIASQYGYAFITDPWSGSTSQFSHTTNTGVATSINVASIQTTTDCLFDPAMGYTCGGICYMVLLAFDNNNTYMSNILDLNNLPQNFGLFIYDLSGNLLAGFPVQFSVNNYVTVGSYKLIPNPQSPAQFIMGGLGMSTPPGPLTYPFLVTINWNFKRTGSSQGQGTGGGYVPGAGFPSNNPKHHGPSW